MCSMVRVPTPDEEDAKRPHREREHLVQDKLRIENRIEALLFAQGIRKRPSLRTWERDVAMARKLLIALWRYVETGVTPDGVAIRGETKASA